MATSGGLVTFMREQLGKPIPCPAVLGRVTEKFREAVKTMAEQQQIPVYQFNHKERKDDVANQFRRERGIRDGIVFVGASLPRQKDRRAVPVHPRHKTVYVNHYYFYIDDGGFGPLFIKVCSYAPGEPSCV